MAFPVPLAAWAKEDVGVVGSVSAFERTMTLADGEGAPVGGETLVTVEAGGDSSGVGFAGTRVAAAFGLSFSASIRAMLLCESAARFSGRSRSIAETDDDDAIDDVALAGAVAIEPDGAGDGGSRMALERTIGGDGAAAAGETTIGAGTTAAGGLARTIGGGMAIAADLGILGGSGAGGRGASSVEIGGAMERGSAPGRV